MIAYEWRLSGLAGEAAGLPFDAAIGELAPKEDLVRMFEHLESALDAAGYFRPPEKRPHMVAALRAMLHRARFSEQEVRTLRGVITALERKPTRPRGLPDGSVDDRARQAHVSRQPMTRLLVFDSGIGGLSVAREIRKALPGAEILYVADDAGFPYGDVGGRRHSPITW